MYNSENFAAHTAKIKVFGVGGGGCNAINNMIESGITAAEFVAINTDSQILMQSKAEKRIQIGEKLTKGLGAGSNPEIGEKAAEESRDEIESELEGTDLLFIAAGMGGGTGTGASAVIARIARELNILTVAVVTRPFSFEGAVRGKNANIGIANLKKYVDTLVIVPNDKLLQFTTEEITFVNAFKLADDMLKQGVVAIVDLIATPSLVNLDFADISTIMRNQGLAHMGIGRAKGEKRVIEAVRQAVSSPLLETTIEGAKSVILNITGGKDMKLSEVSEANELVRGIIDSNANIISGDTIDEKMTEEIKITVIATGFINDRVEPQIDFKPATNRPKEPVEENVPPLISAIEEKERAEKKEEPIESVETKKEEIPETVVKEKVEEARPEKKGRDIPLFVKRLLGKKK